MERSIRIAPTLTEEQPLATFLSSPITASARQAYKTANRTKQQSIITALLTSAIIKLFFNFVVRGRQQVISSTIQ